ncbi:MAG: HTTM domain-containing protein [Candidatus Eiseniibacteriota bacterium]
MALARAMTSLWRSSWNPLRVEGTSLPGPLLLAAKLLVIGLVLKGYHLGFPEPFAPMFAWMDNLPSPAWSRALQFAFLVSAAGLMVNRAVRTNCLILGTVFLLATLTSKVYYRNAKVFVGLLFFLIGLQEKGRSPWLIYWQIALMYFGAGFNKLMEVDWRTGQYFDYFLGHIRQSPIYLGLAPLLPGILLAKLMCWSIFVAEVLAGVLFLFGRTRPLGVWVAAGVHAGAAILVQGDYGIFLSAVLVSYLACLPWPERLLVSRPSGRDRLGGSFARRSPTDESSGPRRRTDPGRRCARRGVCGAAAEPS